MHCFKETLLRLRNSFLPQSRLMPWFSRPACGAVLAAALLLSHGLHAQTAAPAAVSQSAPLYRQSSAALEPRVRDLLDRMSLEEKAYQLLLVPPSSLEPHAHGDASHRPDVGGVIDPAQAQPADRSRLGIPPLAVDASLLRESTLLEKLGATWDTELARRAGAALAGTAGGRGTNAVVLPIASLMGSALNAWSSGEGGLLAGALSRAFADGVQSHRGMMATPAFFPAGAMPQDDARLQAGERQLRMTWERPFEPLLRGDAPLGVVLSPGSIDGVPTAADSALLRGQLRGEWKFAGIVIAAPDAVEGLLGAEHAVATPQQAICTAIDSGVDMQWTSGDPSGFAVAVAECVRDGVISMDTLNRAVSDVLRVKFRLGLFDAQTAGAAANTAGSTPAGAEVGAELAAESVTLLRNEHRVLPLSPSLKSLLVIDSTRRTQAAGTPNMADELRRLLPQTAVAESDGADRKALATAAANAKVVVVLVNGDAPDATTRELMRTALAANDHLVAVSRGAGAPLVAWSARHAAGVLQAWSANTDAHTLARALTGSLNPSGRLPAPLTLDDAEDADAQHSAERATVLPLGFGLSYTTFRYSALSVDVPEPGTQDDVKVRVTVTNTGKLAGDAVVQLYLHHDVSSVTTANRMLASFERVHLDAGEKRTLNLPVPQHALAVWSAAGQWIVEPGPYALYAGNDADAELNVRFRMGEPGWAQNPPSSSDHWIAAPTLEMQGTPAAEFAEAYELAVRVMEYNLRDGLLEAGEGYGTWTRDTSINAWNAASLLIPEVARNTLWHQTELTPDGAIVGGQYWDKVIWIVAARNYVAVTGDRAFLSSAYRVARRTLAAMRDAQYDAQSGLFRGPAVYGDGVAAYPDPPFNDQHGDNVLDYSQGAALETLSTNSVYYGAYRTAAEMGRLLDAPEAELRALEDDAAQLREAIQRQLWLQSDNRFGYFLDSDNRVDPTQEALGEALAVTLGVASAQQAHLIFTHAEVTPWGVPCTWQPYHRYLDPDHKVFGRHNGTIWPFINAFWATAASSAGEPEVFAGEFVSATKLALHSEDFREIYHPYTGDPYGGFQANKTWDSVRHQTWSATGYLRMVFQGLFGMHFEDDGIRFAPTLPKTLGLGSITLRNLTYRDARLTITVAGSGSRIEQCKLDGASQPDPFVPATLRGAHVLEITLSSPAPARRPATRTATHRAATTAPARPSPEKAHASYASSQLPR